MQNNSQLKFWKWAVFLLASLNVFLLASVWLKQGVPAMQRDMHQPPNGERAADFLIEQLKLSKEQMEEFEKLKHQHGHAIDSLRESGKELHHLFFDNLSKLKQDTLDVHKLARAIANNQTQMEEVTYNHFKKVRELCDEKQKATFDTIIQEVLKRMSAPHNGQRPPPPND